MVTGQPQNQQASQPRNVTTNGPLFVPQGIMVLPRVTGVLHFTEMGCPCTDRIVTPLLTGGTCPGCGPGGRTWSLIGVRTGSHMTPWAIPPDKHQTPYLRDILHFMCPKSLSKTGPTHRSNSPSHRGH